MLTVRSGCTRGLAALALGVSWAFAGCSSDHAGQQAQVRAEAASAPAKLPTLVEVSAAVPVAGDEAFPSDLYVERDVWVTPRATGIIEQVLVERGQRVREGQPLVVLETDLAKVELQIAQQSLRFHEAEYARSKELHEQNIVSALDALRDEIERDLAASELERAQALLERCTVRAPFDGQVVDRLAVTGQRVIEDEGAKLVRVVADDVTRAKIHVPEQRLAGLAMGRAVSIALAGGAAGPTLAGRVVFVSPAVDAASDTALVIVEAARKDPALRVGAGVEVRLGERGDETARQDLFRVPRQALGTARLTEGSPATLLVAAGGRAAERRVDLVELDGATATVRGALDPAEPVIVSGGARLAPGDPVDVRGKTP